ncbi:hypothetical protein ACFOEE_00265 [Pseudoalteromonas fenneropenaei]|uniref:Uncharacterized protein n=1 Tax=Pseudoalteromonas fenneropenaei TaxID=1737459 RepID=A0ABV7CC43_9GAMM
MEYFKKRIESNNAAHKNVTITLSEPRKFFDVCLGGGWPIR